MLRHSKTWVIWKSDLEKGLVRKHNHKDRQGIELVEYWVYKLKDTKIWLPDKEKVLLQDQANSYLFAIIVCDSGHIMKETKQNYLIEGVRVTGDSVNDYLSKTGRHID